jgi:transcriptional regulator with XRE-family HTH domain
MDSYSDKLKAYLETAKQDEIASQWGCTQPTISRYERGERFPNREMARKIDEKTNGALPFSLWEAEALKRLGFGEAA